MGSRLVQWDLLTTRCLAHAGTCGLGTCSHAAKGGQPGDMHACHGASRLSVSSYRSTSSMITAHNKYRAHPNVCSPAPLSPVKRTRWPVHCPAVSRRHTWLLQAGQYPRSHRSQATPSSPRTVRGCAAAGPPCSPAAGRCAARTASLLDELCGS